MAPSSLLDLPPEVLLRVVEYASPSVLKALRQSCSALQKMADPALFHLVTIYPHMRSLEQVLNLSLHPRLRHYVKALHYDNRYIGLVDLIIRKIESTYSAHVTPEEKASMISEARKFKKSSLHPGRDDDIELLFLHDIIRNLSCIESISCTESRRSHMENEVWFLDDLPDLYSNLRKMTCARYSCFDLEPGIYSSSQLKQTAARILVACSRAPLGKVTSFEVAYGIWDSITSFEPGGKHISMLSNFLGGLRTLKVSAELNDFHRSREVLLGNLSTVLELAVALQTLHLDFGMFSSSPSLFLERRPGEGHFPSCLEFIMGYGNVGTARWPERLLSLGLGNVTCYKPEFLKLMRQCTPRLKHLALSDLSILPVLGLTPSDVRRPECVVEIMCDVKNILNLESAEFLGEFTNTRGQILSFMPRDSHDSMKSQVEHYMTKDGREHPLEALAIQPGQIDLTEEQMERNAHLDDSSFESSWRFFEMRAELPHFHWWADNASLFEDAEDDQMSGGSEDDQNGHTDEWDGGYENHLGNTPDAMD